MSGGHYDYVYFRMEQLAEAIRMDSGNQDCQIPDDIRLHMDWLADEIEKLAEAAHDVEWLMSDDYGYDTLREKCRSWKLSEHLRKS